MKKEYNFFKISDYDIPTFGRFYQRKIYLEIRDEIKDILVYSFSPGLGDLIISAPFFKTLKGAFPEARLYFLGKIHSRLKSLFESIPSIDEYIFYCPRRSIQGIRDFIAFRRRQEDKVFDLIIDTQRQFVPSLALRLMRPRHMLSYSCKSIFSDWKVFEPNHGKVHVLVQLMLLARTLGIENCHFKPEIKISEKYSFVTTEYLEGRNLNSDLVGICPGAANRYKCWPTESFARLADQLAERHGLKVVLFGGDEERLILEEVSRQMKSEPLLPLSEDQRFGQDLMYSAALMERCRFIIGNDCGGIHLATGVGKSVIVIYGPTQPMKFGPLGDRNIIVNHRFRCSPCKKRNCPLDRKCLKEIGVEEVVGAAEFLIDALAIESQ